MHPRPEMNQSILKGLQVATDTAQDANHWWQAGARLRGEIFFFGGEVLQVKLGQCCGGDFCW